MDKHNVLFLHNQAEQYIKKLQQQFPDMESQLKELVVELSMKECPFGIQKKTITDKLKKFKVAYQGSETATYSEVNELFKQIDTLVSQLVRINQLKNAYNDWSKPYIEKYQSYITTTVKKSTFVSSKGDRKTNNEISLEEQYYDEFLVFLQTLFKPKELEIILKDVVIEQSLTNAYDNTLEDPQSSIVYTDNNRVNLNVKYKYEKKCHFRDTLNQFQGLQNKPIPVAVINDLKDMIDKHGLCNQEETEALKRYSRVTIDHIRLFLTETGHNKYYEDLQLIYSKISGKKCPDISRYEKQLYDDFDELVEAFLSLPDTNRKNFLNVHYVLRQLLKRRGYKVGENHLSNLKTPSRMREHDDIYQKCCEKLHWNFSPLY
jgi:hypothetical protein